MNTPGWLGITPPLWCIFSDTPRIQVQRAAPEPALRAHSPRDGRLVRRATSCGGLSTAATKIPSVSDDDRLAVDKVVPLDESEIANPLSWVTP